MVDNVVSTLLENEEYILNELRARQHTWLFEDDARASSSLYNVAYGLLFGYLPFHEYDNFSATRIKTEDMMHPEFVSLGKEANKQLTAENILRLLSWRFRMAFLFLFPLTHLSRLSISVSEQAEGTNA